MTTTFFLVRHAAHDRLGRTLCGRMPGVTLGAEGRAQAAALAERLAGEGLAAVYASPLERAQETAAPLAARTGLALETLPALNEIDFGAWAGRDFEALHADPAWTGWNQARHVTRPPGGETALEAQARVLRGLEELRQRHGEARLALVSHADLIKLVIAHALGLGADAMQRFEVGPASVSVLVLGDWGTKVESLNERAFLGENA
ncbi:histidine phosphatase family protein [Methylobacterium nonmethylotrophicum]|uniref:Histidine phosphatase family protein n=1 Tax=Methylobacterium nonmethylotrophicum TaxID=1141884 RepID=A0A4Z0NSJ1_9HYPH|nr:histidine phosphatase family protein [Methylobacterium nonmethylotrophicum]TGE00048.1 histidine phosphatase family protein [Methylobacterium nonmethylotrophicum]